MPWAILTNRWVIGALVSVLLLGGAWWKGYAAGKHHVQLQWDAEKVRLEREAQVLADKVRQAERDMQTAADKQQKEKRDAIDRLTRDHRAVLDSLRKRPQRPVDAVPGPAGAAQGQSGCTGAELHREDAEFLIGEAARADTLRAELEACYVQYDAVKR
jgi:hypothetical protein